MTAREIAPRAALAASAAAVLGAFLSDSSAAWGFNYFKYLGSSAIYFLVVLSAVVVYLALGPLPHERLSRIVEWKGDLIWGRSRLFRWLLSLALTGLFFAFRVGTAFLGDGYFLLNIFGRDEAYTGGLIKLLSFWVIKLIQQIFGGYTYWTALYAFQTVSIVAGFFVIYNFIIIAGLLTDSARGRLFSLTVLLGSGWILLFFGYVEYYPMLWLAASFFIRAALACARDRGSLWAALLLFVLTVAIHMQALIFLPGVLYLLARKVLPRVTKQLSPAAFATIVIAMVVAVPIAVWASRLVVPPMDNPFLPFVSGAVEPGQYTAISVHNLIEIANQVALCVPAILVLLSLSIGRRRGAVDHVHRLLVLFSFGSLAFLVTVNPKLGMARDWDLMSLTLLAPALLLSYRSSWNEALSSRIVAATAVLAAGVAIPFLSVNCPGEASTARMHDLLRYYGPRERGGWVSFAKYLQNAGDTPLYNEVQSEIAGIFPEQRNYQVARGLIAKGKFGDAEALVTQLLNQQPDNGEFLAALGDIRMGQGRTVEAKDLYRKALITHPNHVNYYNLGRACMMTGEYAAAIKALQEAHRLSPGSEEVLTSLCRAYVTLKQLEPAKQAADELLVINPKSPDGHIVNIIYLAGTKHAAEAAAHYRAFLESGGDSPEYETIKKNYAWLLEKK